MEMISGIASGTARMPLGVQGTEEEIKINQAEEVRKKEEEKDNPSKPVRDEYIPEKEQEPSGRYWIGKDENGSPKVYFDDPEKSDLKKEVLADSGPEGNKPEESRPEKSEPDSKPEICRGSTDKVDREIEKLKKEKEKLEQQIGSETDETKTRELEKKLSKVESELRKKDNDAYRRQHAVFS